MKYLIIIYLCSLLISFKSFSIDSKASQAIVIDYDTEEILFEKNSDQLVYPASMTKIMTVYLTFDRIQNSDLNIASRCKISPKAYNTGGSRTFLEIDDYVTIDTLLKGIIIQSGNDASVALAECLSGTEENFAKLMNEYSIDLGLSNTNFLNSSGWPNENHYSTVKDIAILSKKLIENFPQLFAYFSEKSFSYNGIKQPNRNLLLNKLDGVDGLKTGFTRKSGWGIAATAKRNNRRVIVVINGTNSSRSRMNEATNLLNWAFNQTNQKLLIDKNQIITNVDVWLGNKSTVNLVADKKIISTLSYDQEKLLTSQIKYTKPISAPVIKGNEYGQLFINIQGKPTIKVPLVAEVDVSKINPVFRIFSAIKYLIFGNSLDEKK